MVANRLAIVFLCSAVGRCLAANEFVAETFMSWDFGTDNSHSLELLLATFILIIVIAFLMIFVLSIIPKCFQKIGLLSSPNKSKYVLPVTIKEQTLFVESKESVSSVLLHSELIRLQGEKMRPKSLIENSADDLLIGGAASLTEYDFSTRTPEPQVVIY